MMLRKNHLVSNAIQLPLLALVAGILFTISANWILRDTDSYSYRSRKALAVPEASLLIETPAAVGQLETYIQQHSNQQVHKELAECKQHFKGEGHLRAFNPLTDCPTLANRKFMVAYYSCPIQAGNRMHHFLNGMFWGMVSNRTLLWHYYDEETCHDIGAAHDPKLCDMVQTEEICGQVLHRADWIPSAKEWSRTLNLPLPELASWWSTHMPPKNDRKTGERVDRRDKFQKKRHPWKEGNEKYTGLDKYAQRVLHIGQQHSWEAAVLKAEDHRRYLLNTTEARQRAEVLVSSSIPFLYGMMFDYAFSYAPQIRPYPGNTAAPDTTITIGLHSRHALASDDGSNITEETRCLLKLLKDRDDKPCAVYIMSDREATVNSIKHHVENVLMCTAVADTSPKGTKRVGFQGKFSEMGNNVGGFYKELALVSSAQYGFVGGQRSSSHLLEEQMYYNAVREGKDPPKSCYLPDPTSKRALKKKDAIVEQQ